MSPEHPGERLVVFVCTANVSRSPYAEFRAREASAGSPVRFLSAGMPGTSGLAMDPAMLAELQRRGVDGSGHRSQPLTATLIEDADLILTVEFRHRMQVLQHWPAAAERVFGFQQFARASPGALIGADLAQERQRAAAVPDSMTWDIADPFGRGRSAARHCAEEIDALLHSILPAVTGAPVRIEAPEPAPRRSYWRRG